MHIASHIDEVRHKNAPLTQTAPMALYCGLLRLVRMKVN